MLSSRDIVILVVFISLVISYLVSSFYNLEESQKTIGQLLTIVTLAITSFYLGYTIRSKEKIKHCLGTEANIQEQFYELDTGVTLLSVIGIIMLVIGCLSITFSRNLLLKHEIYGIYSLLVALLIRKIRKKMGK